MGLGAFFEVLSAKGSKKVDLDTFVQGCIKLRGSAKSMDMSQVMIQQQAANELLEQQRAAMEAEFALAHTMLQYQKITMEKEFAALDRALAAIEKAEPKA